MSDIPPDVIARLRAFAGDPPISSDELNEATRCILAVCPDFQLTGIRMDRRATFTLRDGVRKEITGRTPSDILAQVAGVITGRKVEREEKRRGKGK